jgi:2-keto-4-pentenoate hydratase/2-oxohepta-3-ene-1,7-dioic acid hydratase in catechol pathway
MAGLRKSALKRAQRQRGAEAVPRPHLDGPAIVSWISQCVTLTPGDAIYTGTPGHTSRMNEGDAVEVEIEGIGVLRNRIALA